MKGKALVGQSGGPTAVINSSLCGVIQASLASPQIGKIYGMRWGIEGFLQGEVTDLGSEDPRAIEALRQTPSSALGSCRFKLTESDLARVLESLRKLDVHYLFLIGGNDTMDTISRVEEFARRERYELFGVGVPKTVDNDLFGTDHTPGYGSAARFVALSVQQAGRLADDMQKVDKFVVHQTVGRNAGWLAAASALARGTSDGAPHLIYIPERPLSRERVIEQVRSCIDRIGWVSIVCGEGITWEDGSPVSASETKDEFSNVEYGAMGGTSAAVALHRLISAETGYRGEFQITESLAMCASDRASDVDRREAYDCGRRAVELAEAGESGVMVSIIRESASPYSAGYRSASLREVAVRAKPLPDGFIDPSRADVTASFVDYVRPLVGELPRYVQLSHRRVTA